MSTQHAKPGWQQQMEREIREATSSAEQHLGRAIAYVNDQVVPEVRRSGFEALRTAAVELRRLASRLEEHANSSGTHPPPHTPEPASAESRSGPSQPGEPKP